MTKEKLISRYVELNKRAEIDPKSEEARQNKIREIESELKSKHGLSGKALDSAVMDAVAGPAKPDAPKPEFHAKETVPVEAPATSTPENQVQTPARPTAQSAVGNGLISFKDRQAMRAGVQQEPKVDIPIAKSDVPEDNSPKNPDGTPMTQDQVNQAKSQAAEDAAKNAKAGIEAEQAATKERNKIKPLWSKWHESVANKQAEHGGTVPGGWFSSASKNEGGNPASIPPGMEDQFRVEYGNASKKQLSGISTDAEWEKLFPKNSQTLEDSGRGRVSQSGQYQERGIGKDGLTGTGNWVDMSRPLGSSTMLDAHFGGKWADATPEDRATMLRKELGLPPVGQWWTPDMTARSVDGLGNDTVVGDVPTGLPSNTLRTASKDGKIVGFSTSGPALPSSTPVKPLANNNPNLLEMPGILPKKATQ
jgi:hypothetical protein